MHQTAANPGTAAAPSRKRKSRKKRYIIIGVVALLVLWVVGSIISGRREKPIEVVTEQAVRKTIVQTVSATGKVQPEVEVKISPEVAGEIIDLPVVDGMGVKKGDLLLRIRPDSYQAQLAAQTAAISSARSLSLQLKAAAAKTEQDLKRSEDLHQKRMISESEFLAAKTAHDVAVATYESSLHEIERAEAGSTQARDALSKTTIQSPIDGTVTLLNSKLGERVVGTGQFAGTEVMRVADLSAMEARVDVNENDVVTVKIGDKAIITIDAYGEREFSGTVAQIANTGKTTGAGTQEEVTNFEVKIRIDVPDVQLRPGLSCTADIQTNMVENVVAVPMQSVTIRIADSDLSPEELEKQKQKKAAEDRGDNSAELTNERAERRLEREEREKLLKVVFLKDGNKAKMVPVTTGIADDTYMEIKSGLEPGVEVISGSYSAISRRLKDGSKVEIEKPDKKK
ncbi:MAG: efflux RND transporter periplasmic adaptor subunit [Chthoniobacterales bacterium]|nr:efflux RND transporter periplasmic adaptor subunit [Chthoniobacterales bacterium]